MSHTTPEGDPIGAPVENWTIPPAPTGAVLEGRHCRLERLAPEHASALFEAHARDTTGRNWTYLTAGPFEREADYAEWVAAASNRKDEMHYVVSTEHGPVGTAAYLRIAPQDGSIEVGWITFSPLLQRTRAATEAMYLMMRWAFESGYRRYEWKCNALNAPSRRAAQRFGFSYEGVFRNAQVAKGRNRDTAWYACIDSEWPAIRNAFESWLAPDNFDEDGNQRRSLRDWTKSILIAEG